MWFEVSFFRFCGLVGDWVFVVLLGVVLFVWFVLGFFGGRELFLFGVSFCLFGGSCFLINHKGCAGDLSNYPTLTLPSSYLPPRLYLSVSSLLDPSC